MSKSTNKATNSRATIQRQQYRVLDESTRNRRNRQQLDKLERDNFHEDPHANLVMHKKAPKFADIHSKSSLTSSTPTTRRYNLPRSRMLQLNQLIEEDSRLPAPNYLSIMTRPLTKSGSGQKANVNLPNVDIPVVKRNFCSVCGFKGNYTCILCGLRYCSANCQQVHTDTRCLKWTG